MKAPPSSRGDGRVAALCAAAVVAVYLPALRLPFLPHWDDGANVLQNGGLDLTKAGLRWMLTSSLLGHWHPLTWLSLAADKALWGLDPLGFHLTSVLLHALNAALLYLLARRLLPAGRAAAAFAALFWALHPLRVESVAWVSERRDVLCGALSLGCLVGWTIAAQEPERSARWRRAAFILAAAAMAAKVFAVVLPAALLLVDVRLRGRPFWKEKWPLLVPAGAALALNLAAQSRSGAAAAWSDFGLVPRLAQAGFGFSFYLLKTLWPSGLSPFYERSLLLEPAPFLAGALMTCGVTALLVWRRRGSPGVLLAGLAYAVFLLPALGLFKSGRMTAGDRYSYLPALSLALLAAAGLSRLRPKAALTAGLAWLVALAALTRAQLPVWSSEEALWTRACAESPLSYFARAKLSEALAAEGRTEDAARERAAAEALHRQVFEAVAAEYARRGDQDAAASALRRAGEGLRL